MFSSVDQWSSKTRSLLADINTNLSHVYVLGLQSTSYVVTLNETLSLDSSWDNDTQVRLRMQGIYRLLVMLYTYMYMYLIIFKSPYIQVLTVTFPLTLQQITNPFILNWNTRI